MDTLGWPRAGPTPARRARVPPGPVSRADVGSRLWPHPIPLGSIWLWNSDLTPPSFEGRHLRFLNTAGSCMQHSLQAELAGHQGGGHLWAPSQTLSEKARTLLSLPPRRSWGWDGHPQCLPHCFLFAQLTARWSGPGPSALQGHPMACPPAPAGLPQGQALAPHACSSPPLLQKAYLPEGL